MTFLSVALLICLFLKLKIKNIMDSAEKHWAMHIDFLYTHVIF